MVNQDTHDAIRNVLLATVTAESTDHIAFSDDNPGHLLTKPWNDVLDKGTKCLRMLQSRKAGQCLHTKEERKKLKCNSAKKHKLDFGRLYKIITILKVDGDTGDFVPDEAAIERYACIHDEFTDKATEKKLVFRERVCVISLVIRS